MVAVVAVVATIGEANGGAAYDECGEEMEIHLGCDLELGSSPHLFVGY